VWELWDATKKADPPQQVTFYDEGLGAEHKPRCDFENKIAAQARRIDALELRLAEAIGALNVLR